jgi:hypothetical protein
MPLLAMIGLLGAGACTDDGAATDRAGTTPPTAPADEPGGILYVVDAVGTQIEVDGDVLRVRLVGVERRVPWFGDEQSGVLTTSGFVEQWDDLGFEDVPPQAALVPASGEEPTVVVTLADPVWNDQDRVLLFDGEVVSDVDPQLAGFEGTSSDSPATLEGAVTMFVHQPDGQLPDEDVVGPTTTTTRPTTTTTEDQPTTTTSSTVPTTPQDPSTSVLPTTTTTIFVAPPTPPTTPPPPPDGDPLIVSSTTSIRLPSGGGSTTFSIRNTGTGVGSWSMNIPPDVGISVAPSSGLLFPGSSTTVRVTYDGSFVANDFATQLLIVTTSGTIAIEVTVAG